jgi:hypothetical protein
MAEIRFLVIAEVEHVEGPFVSNADLAAVLGHATEAANPGEIGIGRSIYTVHNWEVEVTEAPKPPRKGRNATP